MLLNYLSSATLVGMGQQLAALSAGMNDLPTNIARTLASAGIPPSAAPGSSASTLPPRAKLPPQLERTDYPGVVHWDRALYKRLRKISKEAKAEEEDGDDQGSDDPLVVEAQAVKLHTKLKTSGVPVTSCYMEDETGEQVPDSQKKAARNRARSFWLKIAKNGETPPASLGKADSDTRDAFVVCMEEGFPWLRYCENYWKSEQIWINHYGSWLVSLKATAGGAVVKTEPDADEEDDEDNQKKAPKRSQEGGETSKSKRPRVDEKEPALPPPTKITTQRVRVRLFLLSNLFVY